MVIRSLVIGMSAVLGGCATYPPPLIKSGVLIDRYAGAACIQARPIAHFSRAWDQVIQGPGCMARVVGVVSSTGRVDVEYPPNKGRDVVAAWGEKSNPTDVRVDVGNCRLYVRSYGTPLFVKAVPTLLVEYDLRRRKELQAFSVEPEDLPPQCPDAPGAGTLQHAQH